MIVTYMTRDENIFLEKIKELESDEKIIYIENLKQCWVAKADKTFVIIKMISCDQLIGFCLDWNQADKIADLSGERIEIVKPP